MPTRPEKIVTGRRAIVGLVRLAFVGALVATVFISNSSIATSMVAIPTNIQTVSTGTITQAITSSGTVLGIDHATTEPFTVISTVERTTGHVAVGDQVTLSGSDGSSLLYGPVCAVGAVATSGSDPSTVVYIRVVVNSVGLREGTTTRVSIIIHQIQGAIIVPTAAIRHTGKSTTVFVESNGVRVSKKVTTGATSGAYTQVTKGLSVGDNVYVK